MSKCVRCSIEILDNSMVCPLCNGVLESEADIERIDGSHDLETEQSGFGSVMYPDIEPAMKKIKFVIKLFVFLSVIVESVLILINYLTYNGFKWSIICGVAMVYMCFTVVYSFQHNRGHRSKILVQMLGAMALAVCIDFIIGYNGWSVNYAIPSAIILVDAAIMILMLVNLSNWQSYIMLQIAMLVISCMFLILVFVGIVDFPLLTIIAVAVSGIMLFATLVFGDRKAVNELSRRFRV